MIQAGFHNILYHEEVTALSFFRSTYYANYKYKVPFVLSYSFPKGVLESSKSPRIPLASETFEKLPLCLFFITYGIYRNFCRVWGLQVEGDWSWGIVGTDACGIGGVQSASSFLNVTDRS